MARGKVHEGLAATAAAQTVLVDPAPSVSALSAAFAEADLEPRYASLSAVIIQRIKVRLGDADLLPIDSTGYALAEAFVGSCAAALAVPLST